MAILSTTDLHQNVLSYNYYGLAVDTSLGLKRTATLISTARQENPNNVLLDDGDAIQGTLLECSCFSCYLWRLSLIERHK